ncbi:MAG: hypothetical protein M1826_004505 [Phylliscum demangeonii]|nr:MAG: hypothetical protein M1826_004505 [Phylliscum demangeonii]
MARIPAAAICNKNGSRKRKRTQPIETTDIPPRPEQAEDAGSGERSNGHDVQSTTPPPSTAAGTSSIPTKTQDGGRKARRRTAKATTPSGNDNGRPPLLQRNSSTNLVTTDIPWPEHFTRLAHTHRALNLVFTFCCTRKHLATTFDNIKTAVESHIKRELTVDDVAQIKALVPRAVNFAYVDEAMLQVHVLGHPDGAKNRRAREFEIVDAQEQQQPAPGGGVGRCGRELLLFEFIDGDLKRQVPHAKTGEPTNPTRRLRDEDLKMPVYSQKQMTKLINKRNVKFTSAVNAFLNQCATDDVDPVKQIQEAQESFRPAPTTESRATTPGPAAPSRALLPATIPTERKSIAEIIEEIKATEWYTGQIVPDGHRVFEPQAAVYGELKFALSQNLVNALYHTRRIRQFYSHQAEAINNLHDGHHVIVSTSTSSGKSLIYQIPVLHELERDRSTRAIYIFPTKALAQDQRRSLKELLGYMDGLEAIIVDTFDGDTPMADRNLIRDEGRIIFTNPDMLHIAILPQERRWRTFLQNLKYVVVDELHVYNGLFGSHVAFIMRRLRRICAAVGNRHVQFISCSATVANPEEHMRTIFGVDSVRLTDVDGSPSGRKEFVCWNTPFKDAADPTSGRGDGLAEAARLFSQLVLRGVRVIAFCRVRKQCELVVSAVKAELARLERSAVAGRVMGYRGGYTAADRRQIEREMFEGKLLGIVATNALELGVDIGSLDAVLTVGFPYTIANLRQQSGRAGRRNRDSLSVLVGDGFATDQHYMEHPDELFSQGHGALQVDLQNMLVLEGHVQCAAFEMPIRPAADAAYFGPQLAAIAAERMVPDGTGFYHCHDRFRPQPWRFVAIRDTEDGHLAVIDTSHGRHTVLEEVEPSRAPFTLYDGAIFLHQGQRYLVKAFAPERRLAMVERVRVDWTTQARDFTDIDPIETEAIRRLAHSPSRAFFGPVRVRAVLFGYFKIDGRGRILDAVTVDDQTPLDILTKGMWLDVPRHALDLLLARRLNVAAAIHAAEHAVLSLMPHFVVSMPGDVRTECKVPVKELAARPTQRKRPARLIFYDAKGGAAGCGVAAKAFDFVDSLLGRAADRVAACACEHACLECVASERCRYANVVVSKAGALVVLCALLGRPIDVDALPWGDEELVPAGIETVVLAEEVRPRAGRRVVVRGLDGDGDGDGPGVVVVKREEVERDEEEGAEHRAERGPSPANAPSPLDGNPHEHEHEHQLEHDNAEAEVEGDMEVEVVEVAIADEAA